MFVSDKASQLFVCQKIVCQILVKDPTAKNTGKYFLFSFTIHPVNKNIFCNFNLTENDGRGIKNC